MNALNEAGKDTGRMVILGSVSTIATYFIQLFFPTIPVEVQAAILALILAGLTYLDSYIHNRKDIKANGLIPF